MDMPLFPYRIYAYNGLAERGYDLTVVSMAEKDVKYDIKLKFRHIRLSYKTFYGLRYVKGMGAVRPEEYDAIILAPNLRMLNFYRFYNKKYWHKLIGWGHHKGCTSGNRIAAAFRNRMFKKFAALIFYDYDTCEDYKRNGYDPAKLYVANNTQYVDLSKVDLTAARDSFLYVGRIQERKSVDMALRAFARLKKEVPSDGLKFRVVGGGESEALKTLVQEKGVVDDVEFTGPIHDEEKLAEVFNAAYAYVSPGHVGLGVLHSLAFGVPVITCLGRKHSVEIANCMEENSFVVEYSDEAVAGAMRRLFTEKGLWQKMSRSAHQYYKESCTIDVMVDGVDNALKYVMSKMKMSDIQQITPPHKIGIDGCWLTINGYSGCALEEWRVAA